MKQQVLNSKNEPVILTPQEAARAAVLQQHPDVQQIKNSLGYELNITTLTEISKSVVDQKFYTIAPADYIPVRVGENAWSSNIVTYRDFQLSGDFEQGVINTGSSDSRLADASAGVDAVTNKVINWAKQTTWSLIDLQMAAKSGNWDIVTSKERSRKRNWDLGIQKVAFVGLQSDTNVKGLLTLANVTADTSTLTGYINALSAANFATFVQTVIEKYRSNAARTAMPSHFIIPEADYNGLATPVSATYPNVMMLDYLLQAFQRVTLNKNFKILPCSYADKATNATFTGLNKNRYTLLNYDEDTIRMDIPVDYGNTMQNSINGFQFQNVGYGQFTGVAAFRPAEVYYMDWT